MIYLHSQTKYALTKWYVVWRESIFCSNSTRETSVLDAFNGVRDCITCVDETRTCRSMREYCTVRLEARLWIVRGIQFTVLCHWTMHKAEKKVDLIDWKCSWNINFIDEKYIMARNSNVNRIYAGHSLCLANILRNLFEFWINFYVFDIVQFVFVDATAFGGLDAPRFSHQQLVIGRCETQFGWSCGTRQDTGHCVNFYCVVCNAIQ